MARIIVKHLQVFLRTVMALFIVFSILVNYASNSDQFSQSKERIIAEEKGDGICCPGLNKYFPDNSQEINKNFKLIELAKQPLIYNNPPLLIRVLFRFSPWSRSNFT